MISLYGYNRSRWIKPYWTLKELGVPFEAKNVRPDLLRAEHPEVVELNPFAKLPVLVDGDFVVKSGRLFFLALGIQVHDVARVRKPLRVMSVKPSHASVVYDICGCYHIC